MTTILILLALVTTVLAVLKFYDNRQRKKLGLAKSDDEGMSTWIALDSITHAIDDLTDSND